MSITTDKAAKIVLLYSLGRTREQLMSRIQQSQQQQQQRYQTIYSVWARGKSTVIRVRGSRRSHGSEQQKVEAGLGGNLVGSGYDWM